MVSSKPRILYISSADPLKGPGAIGLRTYTRFKDAGFEVDMLTTFPVDGHPDILYVRKKITMIGGIYRKFCARFSRLPGSPHYFFYKYEEKPPIPVNRVLKAIKKDYDLLIVYFWQDLLSFRTVDAIYEKLNHPVVFFFPPDYSHMTGGCHHPCDCTRYKEGCGRCPAIHSNDENDFTRKNTLYRMRFYEKVKPIIFGNSYMLSFYDKSFLLKNQRIARPVIPYIDTTVWHPLDRQEMRRKHNIPDNKKFVVLFGCQSLNDPRKGINYLIESLNLWHQRLSGQERDSILLVAAGKGFESIQNELPFDSIGLGMIPVNQLTEFYSMGDIFVCPSVDDAGPSMVGQSIGCGTPVVGFEMGALLDHVHRNNTGYCAKLKDVKDLANGIDKFFKMTREESEFYASNCIAWANNCNYQMIIDKCMNLYNMYKSL